MADASRRFPTSSKPVLVQDTGPSSFLPNGRGMFRFTTPEQASWALAAINEDEGQCRAAPEKLWKPISTPLRWLAKS